MLFNLYLSSYKVRLLQRGFLISFFLILTIYVEKLKKKKRKIQSRILQDSDTSKTCISANNDQGKFWEIRNRSEENSRRVPLKIETFSNFVSLELRFRGKSRVFLKKKGIFKDGRKLIIRPTRNFYFTSNHFDTFYFYCAAINLINSTRLFHYHCREVC